MQLVWLMDRRRFVGTQTEAKALKVPFEVIDVDTSKPGLLAYLNGVEERHERAMEAIDKAETPPAPVEEAPAPPVMREAQMEKFEKLARSLGWVKADEIAAPDQPPIPAVSVDAIEDAMDDMPIKTVSRLLLGLMGRMNALASTGGWATFARDVYRWGGAAQGIERAMGMMLLAGLANVSTAAYIPEQKRQVGGRVIDPNAEDKSFILSDESGG